MKLVLELKGFLPKSPNLLRYKHWMIVRKEKLRAWAALVYALDNAARGNSSTKTTSTEALKAYSTAYATLGLYLATLSRKSLWKSIKLKSLIEKMKEP